ncbi:MAG: class I SAM-dependent methyltransferase [Woeseiaceae bacterium]
MGRNAQAKKSGQSQASSADRHDLYEQSVQDVESEIDFVDETYRTLRGRNAELFREDFCGTASASCEWVRRRDSNHALGVDFDQPTLDWGIEHRVSRLTSEQQMRLRLQHDDVLRVTTDKADVIGAFNFSFYTFKDRETLTQYFRQALAGLADDGMLILDAFGGSEAHSELKEKTEHDGFTYVWHQKRFHPVTGHILCHIHFHFDDGSKMKRAFTYDWRLWTLPEISELLSLAGFSKVSVYWEGADDEGEANGEFEVSPTGEADPAWIAYVVAEK